MITLALDASTYTGDVAINNGGLWNETAAPAISFGGSLDAQGTFTATATDASAAPPVA